MSTGPVPRVDPAWAWRPPRSGASVTLKLDANEGPVPDGDAVLGRLRETGPDVWRRYPDASALEAALASRFGLPDECVLVTAGADEAIDRCCRAYLAPGLALVMPDPTFEMLDRYAALAGAAVRRVPWRPGPFPRQGIMGALGEDTGIVAVVSPNNPTGEVATPDDLRAVASAAPNALVLLDHAYAEYADEDLTGPALAWPNVVVLRTFSKARGLAGGRVGYALGPAPVIAALRAASGPYAVAAPSLIAAAHQLETGDAALREHVARVREERKALRGFLQSWGIPTRDSQANFVFADAGRRAEDLRAHLLAEGVAVRGFPGRPGANTGIRITLPGTAASFDELLRVLAVVLARVPREAS